MPNGVCDIGGLYSGNIGKTGHLVQDNVQAAEGITGKVAWRYRGS